MDIIDSINKLTQDKLINIIKTRLAFLKKTYISSQVIGYLTFYRKSYPYYGFITEFVHIVYDSNGSYYQVISDEYIYSYIKYLKDNNIVNKRDAINMINSFLYSYLGKKMTRLDKKSDCFSSLKEYIPLNDINTFKNKNVATSLEYAVLSQNILTFLGYDTILIVGNSLINTLNDFYAYNLIVIDNNYYLFDFYEGVEVLDKDNNLLYKYPYKLKIDNDNLSLYFNNNTYIVGKDYKNILDKDTLMKVNLLGNRKYSLGNYLLLGGIQ